MNSDENELEFEESPLPKLTGNLRWQIRSHHKGTDHWEIRLTLRELRGSVVSDRSIAWIEFTSKGAWGSLVALHDSRIAVERLLQDPAVKAHLRNL